MPGCAADDRLYRGIHFCFALTTKGRILGTFEVSHGTVDSSLVQPREILMKLLLIGASSFI